MACNPKASTGNQLLDAVPLVEMEALAPDLEWTDFAMRQVIFEQGQHMEYAYFPASGVCSAIAMADIDDQVEMGIIGNEGFVGAAILLMAGQTPFRFISQAPGRALRLPAARLMAASACRNSAPSCSAPYMFSWCRRAAPSWPTAPISWKSDWPDGS